MLESTQNTDYTVESNNQILGKRRGGMEGGLLCVSCSAQEHYLLLNDRAKRFGRFLNLERKDLALGIVGKFST